MAPGLAIFLTKISSKFTLFGKLLDQEKYRIIKKIQKIGGNF